MDMMEAFGKMFLPVIGAGFLMLLVTGMWSQFIPIVLAIAAVVILMRFID